VPGGTGFGTEALAIANNSLGNLHLAGATRAGTGGRGSHNNQSAVFSISRNSRNFQKRHIFPTQTQQTDQQRFSSSSGNVQSKAIRENKRPQRELKEQTNNHRTLNPMTHAQAIKAQT